MSTLSISHRILDANRDGLIHASSGYIGYSLPVLKSSLDSSLDSSSSFVVKITSG